MALNVRRVNYYKVIVEDKHGKGYWLLEHLRQKGVALIAFLAFPLGGGRSQFDFVTDDIEMLRKAMIEAGTEMVGPKRAFLVQGEDKIGAIVELHHKLASAEISAHAASGVAAGSGHFGYILWVKSEDYEAAAGVLGI